MRHISEVYPKTRIDDSLDKLYTAVTSSIKWLNKLQIRMWSIGLYIFSYSDICIKCIIRFIFAMLYKYNNILITKPYSNKK